MNQNKVWKKNRDVYTSSLEKYGIDSPLAVNWGSSDSQQKRFAALLNIDSKIFDSSILDVGCGVGHMVDFIRRNNFSGKYIGIDVIPEMVKAAQYQYPDMSFSLKKLSEFCDKSFDFVLMSGIFTYANRDILESVISDAFRICKKGVAFNSLSSWSTHKENDEYYPDPTEIIDFCQKNFSKSLVFKSDYLSNDFTIYLYRNIAIRKSS